MAIASHPARIPLLLVALILAWGAYLRFSNLGVNTLASDEMNHYFVGQSLATTGEPLLPSGTRYTRGLVYSKLVALALPRFDTMEEAVRFPSAVIGTAGLLLFALIAWKISGPWAAVISTVLFVLYPEGLRLARFGRFYTLQLLAGLAAFYFAWKLTRKPLAPEGFTTRRLVRDWLYFLAAMLAFAAAAAVQITTASIVVGFFVLLAVIGGRDLSAFGRPAWRWSVPLQVSAIALLGGVLLLLVRFDLVTLMWQEARTMPMWARLSSEGPGPISAYYRKLSSHFPLLVSLSPLIFLTAIFTNRRLGGLLLAWFAVPLFLHSFIFPWKSERYVLLAVPALLLATGIAGAVAAKTLHAYLRKNLEAFSWRPVAPATAAGLLVAAIGVGALVTNPAFNQARRMKDLTSAGWEESVAILRRDSALANLPIGSAQPLVALHYWGRLDFTVQRALLESWSRDSTTGGFDSPYRMKPIGSPDVYAGRPTLTTAAAIRDRFRDRKAVVIGVDEKYLAFNNIDPSLREALDHEGRELCENRCGTMRLYHWTFGQEP